MNLTARNLNPDRVQNWSQQKFESFVQKARAQGGEFTIKGRHFSYKVSVNEAGVTSVEVGNKRWYVSKKRAEREDLQHRAANRAQAFADALNRVEDKYKFGSSKVKGIAKESIDQLNRQLNQFGIPEVAMYGKGVRAELSFALSHGGLQGQQKVHTTKIDLYNVALGMTAHSSCKDIHAILQKAREGKLTDEIGEKVAVPSRERVVAWGKFLERQPDRLDVLAKCKKLDKDGLAKFLMKNCPLGMSGFKDQYQNAKGSVAKLRVIIESSLFREIRQAAKTGQIPDNPSQGFDTFYQAAFFRQTSKMGLEFFSAIGVPVVFQVQDMDGQFGKLMTADRLHSKPWKALGTRDGFHEPITYSEMRHVDRLKNNLGKLQEKYRELPSPRPDPLPDIRWSAVPVEVGQLGDYYTLKTPQQSPFDR